MAAVQWGLRHASELEPLFEQLQAIEAATDLQGKWDNIKQSGDHIVTMLHDCPLLPAELRGESKTVSAAAPFNGTVDEFLALEHVAANGAIVQKILDNLPKIESFAAAIAKLFLTFG
jgi:hypothetical protein